MRSRKFLRRSGVDQPYEWLKELTRRAQIDRERLHAFIREQDLDPEHERGLLELTPGAYTGLTPDLVDHSGAAPLSAPE